MRFKSRKSTVMGIIFLLTTLLMLFLPARDWRGMTMDTFVIWALVALPCMALFSGLWFYTFYDIDEKYLNYRSGPFFGKIHIARIRKITNHTNMYVGFKPALASGGMIIHHDRWSDIYISPEDPDRFIEELLKINPDIDVVA